MRNDSYWLYILVDVILIIQYVHVGVLSKIKAYLFVYSTKKKNRLLMDICYFDSYVLSYREWSRSTKFTCTTRGSGEWSVLMKWRQMSTFEPLMSASDYSYVCNALGESRAMLYVVYFQKPCVIRTQFMYTLLVDWNWKRTRTFSCFLSPFDPSRRKRKYYRPRSFKVVRPCPKLNSNSFPNRRARPFDAPSSL